MRLVSTLGLAACASSSVIIETPAPSTDTTESEGIAPLTELCINEFMADNDSSWLDDHGMASDWIELHNPGSEPLSLYGYFLSNDPDDPFAHPLDDELSIEAGEFLLFAADNQPELGPMHLSFRLSSLGESVGLYRYDGAGEVIRYGVVEADVSWSRSPDCCEDATTCMFETFSGTPGSSNM